MLRKRPRWWPIVIPPLALMAVAVASTAVLIAPYSDGATRFTIVAAVATVTGLVLAGAGFVFAVRQLQLLQWDQERIVADLSLRPDMAAGFKLPPARRQQARATSYWPS